MIQKYVLHITEPSRSTFIASPIVAYLFSNYYQVSLQPSDAQQHRQFALWLRDADPPLFRAILAADLDILARDPNITALQIWKFLQDKHHIHGRVIINMPALFAITDSLSSLAQTRAYGPNPVYMNVAGAGSKDEEPAIISHLMPERIQMRMPPTDSLTAEYLASRAHHGKQQQNEQARVGPDTPIPACTGERHTTLGLTRSAVQNEPATPTAARTVSSPARREQEIPPYP